MGEASVCFREKMVAEGRVGGTAVRVRRAKGRLVAVLHGRPLAMQEAVEGGLVPLLLLLLQLLQVENLSPFLQAEDTSVLSVAVSTGLDGLFRPNVAQIQDHRSSASSRLSISNMSYQSE